MAIAPEAVPAIRLGKSICAPIELNTGRRRRHIGDHQARSHRSMTSSADVATHGRTLPHTHRAGMPAPSQVVRRAPTERGKVRHHSSSRCWNALLGEACTRPASGSRPRAGVIVSRTTTNLLTSQQSAPPGLWQGCQAGQPRRPCNGRSVCGAAYGRRRLRELYDASGCLTDIKSPAAKHHPDQPAPSLPRKGPCQQGLDETCTQGPKYRPWRSTLLSNDPRGHTR